MTTFKVLESRNDEEIGIEGNLPRGRVVIFEFMKVRTGKSTILHKLVNLFAGFGLKNMY